MSDDKVDRVAEIRRALAVSAGGYLRNPIREQSATCRTCTTPVNGYDRCYPCNQLHTTFGIADLVVPLTYGIEGEQSHFLVRHYKDDQDAAVRQRLTVVMNRLLFLGIVMHEPCIERKIGQPVDRRLAVPSLSGRSGVHPFIEMTTNMHATGPSPLLVPAPGASSARIVSASQFNLAPETDLTGEHVLILDDTWTRGSRTQSAALALRRYGAKYVSVMVVSRYLKPSYDENAKFIKERLRRDYDPYICPVTGGDCP
ncbi:hypothetical protein BRW65_03960 [Mycobacterium paraffinicum]|uniref:Phosphoribosyltransferase n=1 Tax=Mycobacterium paraffinicum TaxID=53378 RepID=A0A1Q4I169_9MYCO|nr:phosphoribosyltransferase [Mycobacterium paraffinicum]OJZ75699.1 hypothetical protein BRW65_03960 [Mycobacterium paraffinicum]